MSDLKTGIQYEVALDVLGESKQPIMSAIVDERRKAAPSQAFIRYCEMRLDALDELQDNLEPTDTDTVQRILDVNAAFMVR
ncbi:MAG: antitoxin [Betaproteobacteria bacterium]|nr:antitoxin [Betaproteobacteria bacterium]